MEERKLENIAWAVSLIGILLILFISERMEAEEVSIAEINEKMEGKGVIVKAEIEKISQKGGISMLDVSDSTGKIRVVALGDKAQGLSAKNSILIYGKVKIYNGKLEIDASQIQK